MSGKIHLAQTHNEAGIKYDTGQKCNGPMEFGAGLFVQAGLFKISQVGCKVAEKKGGKTLCLSVQQCANLGNVRVFY